MPRSPPPPPPVPSRTVLIPGLINPLTPERVLPTPNFWVVDTAASDLSRDREERERRRENTDDRESTVPSRDRQETDRELPRQTRWKSKRVIEKKCLDKIINRLDQKPSLSEDEYSRIEKEIKKEYAETLQRVTEMEERVERLAHIPEIPKCFYREHKRF
jgi:DNA-directed RNA polymerase specialized sigma54-like protein